MPDYQDVCPQCGVSYWHSAGHTCQATTVIPRYHPPQPIMFPGQRRITGQMKAFAGLVLVLIPIGLAVRSVFGMFHVFDSAFDLPKSASGSNPSADLITQHPEVDYWKKLDQDVVIFKSMAFRSDPDQQIVESINPSNSGPNDIIVMVKPLWLNAPDKLKWKVAAQLWKHWSNLNSPLDPDRAHVLIVDQSGEIIAGSTEHKGSVINIHR